MTWKPPEQLEKERSDRIDGLQKKIFELLKEHPLPPDEIHAALGMCSLWVLIMNCQHYKQAEQIIAETKKMQKRNLPAKWNAWKRLQNSLRKEAPDGSLLRQEAIPSELRDEEPGRPSEENYSKDVRR